jgi:hypothetical protein
MGKLISGVFIVLLLVSNIAYAAERKGVVNDIMTEEQIVIIDSTKYSIAEGTIIELQSDPNRAVMWDRSLRGKDVRYESSYSGDKQTVEKLVILNGAQ